MKKFLMLTVFVSSSCILLAQSHKEEVDLFRSIFGMEKKEVVAEFIPLEGASKDAFWKTYDEYEMKRRDLGKRRIELLNRYVSNYKTMDDGSTDALVTDIVSLQKDTDNLVATYYKKVKKAAGVQPAAKFYHIESYILSKVRSEIMENIPLIGEYDK